MSSAYGDFGLQLVQVLCAKLQLPAEEDEFTPVSHNALQQLFSPAVIGPTAG